MKNNLKNLIILVNQINNLKSNLISVKGKYKAFKLETNSNKPHKCNVDIRYEEEFAKIHNKLSLLPSIKDYLNNPINNQEINGISNVIYYFYNRIKYF